MFALDKYEVKILEVLEKNPKISLRQLHSQLKGEISINTLSKKVRELEKYGYITGRRGKKRKSQLQLTTAGVNYLDRIRKEKYRLSTFAFTISDISNFHPDFDPIELANALSDEQVRYDLGNIVGWIMKTYLQDVLKKKMGVYGGIMPVISKKTGCIYFLGKVPEQLRDILLSFERENLMSLSKVLTSIFMIGLAKEFYETIKQDPLNPKLTIIFWKYDPEKKEISFKITPEMREKAFKQLYFMLKRHFEKKQNSI